MGDELTFAKKNESQNFRIRTASTKVTQSEFAELERAAAERGFRLSEWIREVLFRELRDSDHMNSGDHFNYLGQHQADIFRELQSVSESSSLEN
jgi:hypothetical protein